MIHSLTCLAPTITSQPVAVSLTSLSILKMDFPGWRIPPFKSGQCYCYQTVTKQTCPQSQAFLLCLTLPCRNGRAMKCVSSYTIYNLCIFRRNPSYTLHLASGRQSFSKTMAHREDNMDNTLFAENGSLQIFISTSCLICEDQSVLIKKSEVSKKTTYSSGNNVSTAA